MKIKIKPSREGLKVVKPETMRDLAAEGEVVESSSYWTRRLSDGDIVVMEEIKEEKEEPLKSAKAEKSKNEGGLK